MRDGTIHAARVVVSPSVTVRTASRKPSAAARVSYRASDSQQNAGQNRPSVVGRSGEDHLLDGRLEDSTIDFNDPDLDVYGCAVESRRLASVAMLAS